MADTGPCLRAIQCIIDDASRYRKVWQDIHHADPMLLERANEVIAFTTKLIELHRGTSFATIGANEEYWKEYYLAIEACIKALQELIDETSTALQGYDELARSRLCLRVADLGLEKYLIRLQSQCEGVRLARATVDTSHHLVHYPCLETASESQSKINQGRRPCTLIAEPASRKVETLNKRRCSTNVNKGGAKTTADSPYAQPTRNINHHDNGRAVSSYTPTMQWLVCGIWRCFRMLWHRRSRSLRFNLRVYNMCPHDAKHFKLARERNWKGVFRMITNGKAHPFDVDERGNSLLHIAAVQARPDACRFLLLKCGLDPSYRSLDQKTALEALSLSFRFHIEDEPKENFVVDTVRLLLASPSHDIYASEELANLLLCTSLSANALSYAITATCPSYRTINAAKRCRYAMSNISLDAESFDILLGQGLSRQMAFKLASEEVSRSTPKRRKSMSRVPPHRFGHRRLLVHVARCLAKPYLTDQQREGWLSVLSDIIAFESQKNTTTSIRSYYAAFTAFYLGANKIGKPCAETGSWNDVMTSIGKLWLQMLVSCGANLRRYAKAEKSAFLHSDIITWKDHRKEKDKKDRFYSFQTRFLICGPQIEDWKLFVVPHTHRYKEELHPGMKVMRTKGDDEYEMAGSFWDIVEQPELFLIPGAFLEEGNKGRTGGNPVRVRGPIL